MKNIKSFACACLLAMSSNAMSQGLTGTVKCKMMLMVDMTTGKEAPIKGDELWSIIFKAGGGTVVYPSGKSESLSFVNKKPGPKATGYVYRFTNSEIFEKLQINTDVGASLNNRSIIILDMKRVANMDVSSIGVCNM